MAKKKRDFWDEVDEEVEVQAKKRRKKDKAEPVAQDEYEDDYMDEGFRLTKNMPVKIITRILLFLAAVVMIGSAYICYKYVEDRYDNGFATSYFSSAGFSSEYNHAVEQVLKVVEAVEADPTLLESEDQLNSLIDSMTGGEGSFAFIVKDAEKRTLFENGENAKERIEASHHYLKLSTTENTFNVEFNGIPTKYLNKEGWQTTMDNFENIYIIYTAVDNNLEQTGAFYEGYLTYEKFDAAFSIARIACIAALVVFILLLIFCAVATGRRKGTSEIKLSWFDHIFTEIAAIIAIVVLGAIVYGGWFVVTQNPLPKFQRPLEIAAVLLLYIFLVRFYFSLVRRIKTGRFVGDSLIYRIGHLINRGLNHLPKALKVIIVILFLIALNGALVFGLLYMRDLTVRDIPVIYIVAPVVFVIELIAFISCLFGGVPENYDDEGEEAYPEAEEGAVPELAEGSDWSDVDFGSGAHAVEAGILPEEKSESRPTQENIIGMATDKTVMLSPEETDLLRKRYENSQAPAAEEAPVVQKAPVVQPEAVVEDVPADDAALDFIQLNKDVRKMFKSKLKAKAIGATLRAPENPILLDIDKSNAIQVLSILFDNVTKYAQEGSRVYIEMYVQKDKMIYMMKNTISEDLVGTVTAEMGESLKKAKKIVKSEGGKFITNVDGNIFKAGILLPIANN